MSTKWNPLLNRGLNCPRRSKKKLIKKTIDFITDSDFSRLTKVMNARRFTAYSGTIIQGKVQAIVDHHCKNFYFNEENNNDMQVTGSDLQGCFRKCIFWDYTRHKSYRLVDWRWQYQWQPGYSCSISSVFQILIRCGLCPALCTYLKA